MNVHDSFTKKDLVEIIKEYNFDIDVSLSKYQIINELKKFNIEWLNDENENKRLSIKDKNLIILKSKKIISFVKNGCNIESSLYSTMHELLTEAKEIGEFGDISSVRRAIGLLNKHLDYNISCFVSDEVLENINMKKKIKKSGIPSMQIERGKFKVF